MCEKTQIQLDKKQGRKTKNNNTTDEIDDGR